MNIIKAQLRCYICGIVDGLSDHHLNPREDGGTDHPVNLITLCLKHHDWAEDKSYETIERERELYQVDRQNRKLAADEIEKLKRLKYALKPHEWIGQSGLIWGYEDEIDFHGRITRVVYSRTPEPEELVWLRTQQIETSLEKQVARNNQIVQKITGGERVGAGRPKSESAKSPAERAKAYRDRQRHGNQTVVLLPTETPLTEVLSLQ